MSSGDIGVASKEKEPSSASWADRRRFWQQGRSMFRVASHCESAPVGNEERLGEASHAREKVILSGADCAFRRICAMYVGWRILEVSLLQADEALNLVQCLFVHFVKEGFEAVQRQPLVGDVVGTQEFLF